MVFDNVTFALIVEDVTVDVGTFNLTKTMLSLFDLTMDRFAGEINQTTVTVYGYNHAPNNCIDVGPLPPFAVGSATGIYNDGPSFTSSQNVTYTVSGSWGTLCDLGNTLYQGSCNNAPATAVLNGSQTRNTLLSIMYALTLNVTSNNPNNYTMYNGCKWRTACGNSAATPCDAQSHAVCGIYTQTSNTNKVPACYSFPAQYCPTASLTGLGAWIDTYPSCTGVTHGYYVPKTLRLQAFGSDGQVLAGYYFQIQFQSNPNLPHPINPTGGCNAVGEAIGVSYVSISLAVFAAALTASGVAAVLGVILAGVAAAVPAVITIACTAATPSP